MKKNRKETEYIHTRGKNINMAQGGGGSERKRR